MERFKLKVTNENKFVLIKMIKKEYRIKIDPEKIIWESGENEIMEQILK
jgi:hypothetical protein